MDLNYRYSRRDKHSLCDLLLSKHPWVKQPLRNIFSGPSSGSFPPLIYYLFICLLLVCLFTHLPVHSFSLSLMHSCLFTLHIFLLFCWDIYSYMSLYTDAHTHTNTHMHTVFHICWFFIYGFSQPWIEKKNLKSSNSKTWICCMPATINIIISILFTSYVA